MVNGRSTSDILDEIGGYDMSGHNKWANIKHRKGAQDAKRSKVFTKIIRELMVSAREGGSDPNTNTLLKCHRKSQVCKHAKRHHGKGNQERRG